MKWITTFLIVFAITSFVPINEGKAVVKDSDSIRLSSVRETLLYEAVVDFGDMMLPGYCRCLTEKECAKGSNIFITLTK